jgi:hypothetical protein
MLPLKPSFNISVVYLLYCVSICFQILERILNSITIEKASAKLVGHLGGEWSQIQSINRVGVSDIFIEFKSSNKYKYTK